MPRYKRESYRYKNVARLEILIRSFADEPGVPARQFLRTGTTGLGVGKVRPLVEADLDETTRQGRRVWAEVGEDDRRRLIEVVALKDAIENDDPIAVKSALKRLEDYAPNGIGARLVDIVVDRLFSSDAKERQQERWALFMQEVTELLNPVANPDKFDELVEKISHVNQGDGREVRRLVHKLLDVPGPPVRVVFWWNGKRLLPALFCKRPATALTLHTLLHYATGKSLRVCPACHKLFLAKLPYQDYCGVQHRESYRVTRYRARKKQAKGAPAA